MGIQAHAHQRVVLENLVAAIVVHQAGGRHLIQVVNVAEQEAERARQQQGDEHTQRDDSLEDALETQQLVAPIDVKHHNTDQCNYRRQQSAAAGTQDDHDKGHGCKHGTLAALIGREKAGGKEGEVIGHIGAHHIGMAHSAHGSHTLLAARRRLAVKNLDSALHAQHRIADGEQEMQDNGSRQSHIDATYDVFGRETVSEQVHEHCKREQIEYLDQRLASGQVVGIGQAIGSIAREDEEEPQVGPPDAPLFLVADNPQQQKPHRIERPYREAVAK